MPPTLSPQAARDRFLAEQKISFSPGRLAVECAVCGSDYGGTSWPHHGRGMKGRTPAQAFLAGLPKTEKRNKMANNEAKKAA